MGLGWTSSEHVVIIMRDGSMAVYNIHGQQQYTRVITRVGWEGGRGGEGRGGGECPSSHSEKTTTNKQVIGTVHS